MAKIAIMLIWMKNERFYEIEANSKEEAEEKLIEGINDGGENAPDQCYDSGAEATEME